MRPFETLHVWHDARALTKCIYQSTRRLPFKTDKSLAGQLQRAAISVMSNIAEGCERGGTKQFRHFVQVAKGSCGEIRAQLYAAEDLGYLTQDESMRLRAKAASISRRLTTLASRLQSSPNTD